MGLALSLPAPAQAHAQAVASWPAVGQVVRASPTEVIVEFSTDIAPETLVGVIGPDRLSLVDGEPIVEGNYVVQPLVATDQVGQFSASFHVVSVDMHPIFATIDFTVDPDGSVTVNPAGDPPELAAVDTEAPGEVAPTSGDTDGGGAAVWLLAGGAGLVAVLVAIRVVSSRRGPQSA